MAGPGYTVQTHFERTATTTPLSQYISGPERPQKQNAASMANVVVLVLSPKTLVLVVVHCGTSTSNHRYSQPLRHSHGGCVLSNGEQWTL